MPATTLNQVLDLADGLPPAELELLVRVLRRRQAEAWCRQLVRDARKASQDWRAGRLRPESHEAMKARLRTTLDSPDE